MLCLTHIHIARAGMQAEATLRRMLRAGFRPRDYAYCGLIAAYSLAGDTDRALGVRRRVRQVGRVCQQFALGQGLHFEAFALFGSKSPCVRTGSALQGGTRQKSLCIHTSSLCIHCMRFVWPYVQLSADRPGSASCFTDTPNHAIRCH